MRRPAFSFVAGLCCLSASALNQPEFWKGQRVNGPPPTPSPSALASRLMTTTTPPEIVVLPGFGNDRSDYTDADYPGCSMCATLERRGFSASVLPVRTGDWLQVFSRFAGSPQAWRGAATAENPAYAWYIRAAREQIRAARERSGQPVVVVGHSAGGWLARAAVGLALEEGSGEEGEEGSDLRDIVAAIVSLGAPHVPPPAGVFDPTRGVVADVYQRFPASFFLEGCVDGGGSSGGGGGGGGEAAEVSRCAVVTVAGDGIVGDSNSELPWARASATAYSTFGVGGGEGGTEGGGGDGNGAGIAGDGTVPVKFAHLPGASLQLTLDAMHSVVVPGTSLSSTTWYGAERMVDRWLGPTMDLIVQQRQRQEEGQQ